MTDGEFANSKEAGKGFIILHVYSFELRIEDLQLESGSRFAALISLGRFYRVIPRCRRSLFTFCFM